MDDRPTRRLTLPVAVAAAVAALVIGLLIGGALNLKRHLFGDPSSIARSSLVAMRAQNRLVPFVARYVSVVSSKQSQLMFTSERTLILPGDVRYEVDLAKLGDRDVTWNADSKTLTVKLPEIDIAGPEVDLAAAREYGGGGVLRSSAVSRCRCTPPASPTRRSSPGSLPIPPTTRLSSTARVPIVRCWRPPR
ncbi:MAG: DUF4230 domain-containing protein [Sphingomonadales bacterium]|nr:DUF4230 domain-containing protein [Sphingomonadales bacterium]